MRLPNTAHTSRPWRIHELTCDFRLEDVWALPTQGGPDDFPRLVQRFASADPSQSSSRAVRTLFAIRWKLGGLLGWDDPDAGLGSRVPTLRDRLPADLRETPGPDFDALPFTSLGPLARPQLPAPNRTTTAGDGSGPPRDSRARVRELVAHERATGTRLAAREVAVAVGISQRRAYELLRALRAEEDAS